VATQLPTLLAQSIESCRSCLAKLFGAGTIDHGLSCESTLRNAKNMPIESESAKLAMELVKGQPFTNVLLAAIFCAGCYGCYFMVNVAIPNHLKTIQDGYERIEESHKTERTMRIEMYDKWMLRFDKQTKIN
jgi:hypothetical protein